MGTRYHPRGVRSAARPAEAHGPRRWWCHTRTHACDSLVRRGCPAGAVGERRGAACGPDSASTWSWRKGPSGLRTPRRPPPGRALLREAGGFAVPTVAQAGPTALQSASAPRGTARRAFPRGCGPLNPGSPRLPPGRAELARGPAAERSVGGGWG